MGFLDKLFNRTDINIAVEQFQATPGAFLIDVRTGPEYEAGHIEGAVNVPLNSIHFIVNHVRDINAPLYVYCQSGARSGQAVSMIREMGYKNVTLSSASRSHAGYTLTKYPVPRVSSSS